MGAGGRLSSSAGDGGLSDGGSADGLARVVVDESALAPRAPTYHAVCGLNTKRVGRSILAEGYPPVRVVPGLPREASPVLSRPRLACMSWAFRNTVCVTRAGHLPHLRCSYCFAAAVAAEVSAERGCAGMWGQRRVLFAVHRALVDRMRVWCPPSSATHTSTNNWRDHIRKVTARTCIQGTVQCSSTIIANKQPGNK